MFGILITQTIVLVATPITFYISLLYSSVDPSGMYPPVEPPTRLHTSTREKPSAAHCRAVWRQRKMLRDETFPVEPGCFVCWFEHNYLAAAKGFRAGNSGYTGRV